MPSLRSNKNKIAIPPYPPPDEAVCIPVTVPNDPHWVGLFLGALHRLTQQIWYDRDEAHTAKLVAAKWRDIYLETMNRAWDCGDDSLFDVRVNPADSCSIQKTTDGVLWTEVFRLDSPCATSRLRVNPYTGRLGRVNEDLTFYEFPDGDWGTSLYPPFSSLPPPIAATDRACVAATTAVYVLSNLYRDIGTRLLDEVAATDWDYAATLGSILQGFLLIIGAAAVQPYVAFATLLSIVGVRQQYVDYPLSTQDVDDLTCLFYEHATEIGDSVVFDFQAIWNNIALDSPKNGLFRFMMTMIGPDAVNYAGAVEAGLVANCAPCFAEWCYTFDFTASNGGFARYNSASNAMYSVGNGWRPATGSMSAAGNVAYTSRSVNIYLDLPSPAFITTVELEISGGNATQGFLRNASGGGVIFLSAIPTSDRVVLNLNDTVSYIAPGIDRGNPDELTSYLTRVTLYGTGTNPFGGDNC